MIDPEEASRLIRAIAYDNTFNRGRKSRMEAWKVMFGVYVSARYKHPTYTLAGLRWKLHYSIAYSGRYRHDSRAVKLPTPNIYTKQDKDRSDSEFIMTFTTFEGSEEAFKRDFTILRMFESEWSNAPGRASSPA